MFDYCTSIQPLSAVCTRELFDQVISSETVIRNCAAIRHLVETQTDAELLKNEIGKWKTGDPQLGIKSLPGFCFHAHFPSSRRSNVGATPSGLTSLDLDDIPDPREFFRDLQETALQLGLCLAYVTPSTRGLKLVFVTPSEAVTLEEAQEWLVERLGVKSYFDQVTHDLSRLAFAVPADYILYRNDEELFRDRQAPQGFCTEQQRARQTISNTQVTDFQELPRNEATQHFVDGFTMEEIVRRVSLELCGQEEPPVSSRNQTLFDACKLMRVVCDDDNDLLRRVMPQWGQSDTEWNSTLRSACTRPISAEARKRMEHIISQMKRERALEQGGGQWALPPVPEKLPPVFKEFARITPEEYRPAQLLSLLPILGFYGTMAKANMAENDEEEDWRTPSFITVVSAPPASGKSMVTRTYNRLTEEQRLLEQPLLEQLNRYNATKKEEDMPQTPIRLMPERLSMTSLSQQLEWSKGQHLLLFTPEIDTLKSCNGSGAWNDLSTIFRKSLDNDPIGQIYMSGESHCCNVPVYLNMLIEAQPETMKSFFNRANVLNGLTDRVLFIELPENLGIRKAKIKKMSDFEWKNVMKQVEALKRIGVELEPEETDEAGNVVKAAVIGRQELSLPQTRKLLNQWGNRHQDHYLQNQENPAEDHFMRRSKLIAFHAAMVAYMVSGCKETKAVRDFALWVAEYSLQSQLLHFGTLFNDLRQKRLDNRTDQIMEINKVSKFNLYDALPEEFTTMDMQDLMRQNGRSMKNPYNAIHTWVQAGLITQIPTQTQKKRWRKKLAEAAA